MLTSVYPSPALSLSSSLVLSPEQVTQWRTEGYTLVSDVFPDTLLQQVRNAAIEAYPEGTGPMKDELGSGGKMTFPVCDDAFQVVNKIPLHMRLITAVTQLLGCNSDDLRLSQADLWGKRGYTEPKYDAYCNMNQRIHCDYPNHTLVMPPSWDNPEVVSIIIYYDDSATVGGGTRIVPREGSDDPAYTSSAESVSPLLLTPGARGDLPWINDKDHAEEYLRAHHPEVHKFRQEVLYPREKSVAYGVGTVLFYRHDIWHRGTPPLPNATRRIHNIVYKLAHCDWVNLWNSGSARRMYTRNQVVERLIAGSCSAQRVLLGFPAPSSNYWNEDTLQAVKDRYSSLPGGFMHCEEIEEEVRKKKRKISA
mmetsp:Transcript_23852/g.34985  ORF Transcript_23852/g.34985 Transcript_23852/m.34985 type:complete len:365 (+) Transcript_23852:35-1129(+)